METSLKKTKIFNPHPVNNYNHLLGYSYNPDGKKMNEIDYDKKYRHSRYEIVKEKKEQIKRLVSGEECIFQSKMNFKSCYTAYNFLKKLMPGTCFPIKNIPDNIWLDLELILEKDRNLIIVEFEDKNYIKRL
jgi:hypothetical protein